jgi:hypothetical protein
VIRSLRLQFVLVALVAALGLATAGAGAAGAAEAPGTISRIAGEPALGGPALSVGQWASTVAVSGDTLYTGDWNHGLLRAVDLGSGVERTVAGAAGPGFTAEGIPASAAGLGGPTALTTDPAGNVLIADGASNRVLMIAAADCSAACAYGLPATTTGNLYTVFGNGTPNGNFVEGAPGRSVSIQSPWGVAVDARGDLFASTYWSAGGVVRVLAGADCAGDCPFGLPAMTRGDAYTVAGGENGVFDPNDGGEALDAAIKPGGLTVDGEGNLILTNAIYYEGLVSMVAAHDCSAACPYGLPATTAGHIYTLAGADSSVGHQTNPAGDGSLATTQDMAYPTAVQVDGAGNLLVDDQNDGLILVRAAADCAASCAYGLPATTAGHMYAIAGGGQGTADGEAALASSLATPSEIALVPGRGIFIAEAEGKRVRLLSGGVLTTVAGNGTAAFSGESGPAGAIQLDDPTASLSDPAGNVVFLDGGNDRVRVLAAADCAASCAYGLPATTAGSVYTIAGGGSSLADGVPGRAADLEDPHMSYLGQPSSGGLALDGEGNLLISDSDHARVRLLAAGNCVGDCPYGLAATTAGDIYTVAGSGQAGDSGGDGGPAIGAKLSGAVVPMPQGFNSPDLASLQGLALDSSGNLLIADTGNDRVLLVARHSCAAACPYGLPGTVSGGLYTVAGGNGPGGEGDGGAASAAQLFHPAAVAVDGGGNLLIADTGNHRVRFVAAAPCGSGCAYGRSSTNAGTIYPLAGTGEYFNPLRETANGDGGRAREAKVTWPEAIAVDRGGDVAIAEPYLGIVRLIAGEGCSGTCAFGLPKTTKNYIYTVAGSFSAGNLAGEGGPASAATLHGPAGLGFAADGALLIGEGRSDVLRRVAPVPAAGGGEGTPETPVEGGEDAPAAVPASPPAAAPGGAPIWRRPIRFSLAARHLDVSGKGTVVLRLGVSAAASGKVRLDYRARRHGKAVTATGAKAGFVAGKAGVVRVVLRLNAAGRAQLRRQGSLHSTLTLASAGDVQRFKTVLRQRPATR